MKLNDKVYDILKWMVILVLPTLATLYATLSPIWGWPLADEITKTIAAVTTALGVLLGISTAEYRKQDTSGPDEDDPLYNAFIDDEAW